MIGRQSAVGNDAMDMVAADRICKVRAPQIYVDYTPINLDTSTVGTSESHKDGTGPLEARSVFAQPPFRSQCHF
jgi:hypothetical protein